MKKTKHFNEKSAARCVAYARRDGANDWELVRFIIIALGLSNIPRLIAQSLLAISDVVLAGLTMTLLTSLLSFMRGLKIFVEGRISDITIVPIEQFIRLFFPKLQGQYGLFLVYLSGSIVILETTLTGLISIANQIVYYRYIDDLYKIDVEEHPFPITPPPINIDLFDVEYDQSKYEQFFEIIDLLFDEFEPP